MAYFFSRKITIDHTKCGSVDSVDYPLLFSGTYAWLANFANGGHLGNASGFDLIFALDNLGASLLSYERVTHDVVTGAVEFYVKVPLVSASVNTDIYILYGDAAVTTDQSDRHGTWNSGYVGVWHFGDGVTLDLSDSTVNANNGTNVNGVTAGAALTGGAGGGSAHFTKSSSQYIDFSTPTSLNINGGPWTVEARILLDSAISGAGDFRGVYSKYDNPVQNGYAMIVHDNTGFIASCLYTEEVNGGTTFSQGGPSGAPNVSTGTYYTVAGRIDGAHIITFVSGVPNLTDTLSSIFPGNNSTAHANIGRLSGYNTYYFDGRIDEVRVTAGVRSNSWILANHNNTVSPATFYAIDVEVIIGTLTSIGITQALIEVATHGEVGAAPPFIDITQAVIEVVSQPEPFLDITQAVVEVAQHPPNTLDVTHALIEVAYIGVPHRRSVKAKYTRARGE